MCTNFTTEMEVEHSLDTRTACLEENRQSLETTREPITCRDTKVTHLTKYIEISKNVVKCERYLCQHS